MLKLSDIQAAGLALLLLAAAGCSDTDTPPTQQDGGVLVLAPQQADPVVDRLVTALKGSLTSLAGSAPQVQRLGPGSSSSDVEAAAQQAGAGLVLVIDAQTLAPDVVPATALSSLGEQGFRVTVREAGQWNNRLASTGATMVYTAGKSKLAKQYAVYEVLRRLGARFYHPEQEHLPQNDPAQLRQRAATPTVVARRGADGKPSDDYLPDFTYRSYSFHGSHPLEHLEAFSDGSFPMDEARNVNDWIIKNRGNLMRGAGRGVASAADRATRVKELEALRVLLGFPRGAGITLHNQQQGNTGVVDPKSAVPPQKQIEDYVAARLRATPDAYNFGIHFGPTEFTVTPDKQTVDWINWAGRKALSIKPGIRVTVNDHTTGSQATANFGDLGCPPGTNSTKTCDYYDLAFHTDKRFAVKVHTVMFYPLEGPARVYNQLSFAHKLCLMKQASAAGRPLVWFPEGSWWLSFDNPIPVYLPLYIWTRGRDVELIKPLLKARGKGTVDDHRMFNSGHEWGYWQQDYAVGLWHWNADVTLDQVLGELFDPLCAPRDWATGCAARTEAVAVLKALMKHQKDYLLDLKDYKNLPGGLYAYMAGEDPADEIAAATGFEFRPVRVAFAVAARWSDKQIKLFRGSDLAALEQMRKLHKQWLDRLTKVRDAVPAAGRKWLDEVVDGVEINMLRAQQTYQLYDAVLTYREAQLNKEADPAAKAKAAFAAAAKTLTQAQTVIRRREQQYRYPAAQVHGGGVTAATGVKNGTTYPWRVHTKTHLLTYWNSRHAQVKQVLDGKSAGNDLDLDPVFADPGTKLKLTWPGAAGLTADVTVGQHKVGVKDTELALGSGEGVWTVAGKLSVGGKQIPVSGGVVRAKQRASTPAKGLSLVEPKSGIAQTVLNSLFPPMVLASVGGAKPALALAPDLEQDSKPSYRHVIHAPLDSAPPSTGGAFTTKAVDVQLPIPSPGSGGQAVTLGLKEMTLSGKLAANGAIQTPMRLAGKLVLKDLVKALVDLAGFDEKGAYQTLGGVLGFDPNKPPVSVKVAGDLKVQ